MTQANWNAKAAVVLSLYCLLVAAGSPFATDYRMSRGDNITFWD